MCGFNGCDLDELCVYLRNHKRPNLKFLQKESVVKTHRGIIIKPDDITSETVNKIFAFRNHKSRTTVEQYYFVKYRLTLRSYLPCVVVKGGKDHIDYYPIETLYWDSNESPSPSLSSDLMELSCN